MKSAPSPPWAAPLPVMVAPLPLMVTFLVNVNCLDPTSYVLSASKSIVAPSSALSINPWISVASGVSVGVGSSSAKTFVSAGAVIMSSPTASLATMSSAIISSEATSSIVSAETAETEIATNNTKRKDKIIFLFIFFLLYY